MCFNCDFDFDGDFDCDVFVGYWLGVNVVKGGSGWI